MFDIGDIVHTNGQLGSLFEVIHLDENSIWISDGHVQITRTSDRLKLVCKAENRLDEKVPIITYWKS